MIVYFWGALFLKLLCRCNCVLYRLSKAFVNLFDRLFGLRSVLFDFICWETHRPIKFDINRHRVAAWDESNLMWRLWLLSQEWSLSLYLLYLMISICTLTRSQATSILAWSATSRCHYWILVRNTAFTTLIVWISISGIVPVIGSRLSCHFWSSHWYHLHEGLGSLNRHLSYVRLGCF